MALVSEFLGQLTLQLGGVSFHTSLFIYGEDVYFLWKLVSATEMQEKSQNCQI